MSLKWPNKDPDEILDYSIDWSRFLSGATLSSVTWFVDDAAGVKTQLIPSGQLVKGIQLISATNTDKVATARLGSGDNNIQYQFYCRIADTNGLVVERKVRLRVRNK
jgi:hypothetical protein